MKTRFRLFRRGSGSFYVEDTETGKQQSLHTKNRHQAERLVHARNEAVLQPAMNLQIARAYLVASDPDVSKRDWQFVMTEIVKTKNGATGVRWHQAIKDKALDLIRNMPLLETRSHDLLKVMEAGTVATNAYLRRLHNYAVGMNWLPWPILGRKQWPPLQYKPKRAITLEEHQKILVREMNPERHAFYSLAWYLGASQSDLANLQAEDVDWGDRIISFERCKTRWRGQQPPQISFGIEVEQILHLLPRSGPLFPYLRSVRSGDRATEFKQRCNGLGIYGVSLHSYRYAWAERAKKAGYPERFAQQALGHNSKAVSRAYAKKALVRIPSLEEYERQYNDGKIIRLMAGAPSTIPAGGSLG